MLTGDPDKQFEYMQYDEDLHMRTSHGSFYVISDETKRDYEIKFFIRLISFFHEYCVMQRIASSSQKHSLGASLGPHRQGIERKSRAETTQALQPDLSSPIAMTYGSKTPPFPLQPWQYP